MSTGIARIEIYLPKDNETIYLQRDQRFMVDDADHALVSIPTVFSISKTNLIQNTRLGDSLFHYIMIEGEYNPNNDNRELLIADYYNRIQRSDSTPLPFQDQCKITYTGNPWLRVGGTAKEFTAEFYDSAGVLISDIATWTIYEVGSTTTPLYITIVDQTSTTIQLRCDNDVNLIGKTICLKLECTSGLTENVLDIDLVSLT